MDIHNIGFYKGKRVKFSIVTSSLRWHIVGGGVSSVWSFFEFLIKQN